MLKQFFNIVGINKKVLKEVFTPSTAALINYLNRPSLEKTIDKNIDIPGTQIIIYGHSGSGKTTLVSNALKRVGKNFISINCTSKTTFNQIIVDTFDELNPCLRLLFH